MTSLNKLQAFREREKIEQIKRRISWLQGAIEGIRLYAIWKDGGQLVGAMRKPLKQVLEPYFEEIERLGLEIVAAESRVTKLITESENTNQ